MLFQDATFFTKDKKSLDAAMEQVKALPLNWDFVEVRNTSDFTFGITETIQNMSGIIKAIKFFAIAIAIVILSIISFIWLQERKKEIGTYMALGIKKKNICAQLVLEILLVAILALSISYFSGNAISQQIGDKISDVAAENATREIRKGFTSQLGADIQSSLLTKTLDRLIVTSTPSDMIKVAVYTIAAIGIVETVTLTTIMRKKPRDLLLE